MKKLTAGILASLIGLVSANSADAAVASKAYVDGAIETLDVAEVGSAQAGSVTYIKNIKEVDGKIEATSGDLDEIAIKGIAEGSGITFTEGTNGETVINTNAEGKGTVSVSYDTNGKMIITGTDHYAEGDGIDIEVDEKTGKSTISTDAIGTGSVTVTYNENGQMVINGTDDNSEYTFSDDIVEDENGAYHTSYYDATNADVKTAEQETTAGDGWYVLMRKADATQPNGYKYQWENLDRSYDANEISVAHNEGTQPVQE